MKLPIDEIEMLAVEAALVIASALYDLLWTACDLLDRLPRL